MVGAAFVAILGVIVGVIWGVGKLATTSRGATSDGHSLVDRWEEPQERLANIAEAMNNSEVGATAAELRHAHELIAQELAPEAIDAALSAELGDRLDAIREVLAEALRVLTNDRLRSRYLAHLG